MKSRMFTYFHNFSLNTIHDSFRSSFRDRLLSNFSPSHVLIIVMLLSAGCGQYASVSSVDPLAKEYFEALQAGDLDKAMSMYSEDFFASFPREVWLQKLKRLTAELGPIKAYSFRNKQADSRFSGKFYIYQYDTIHESGGKEKRAKHTITFIQPVNSTEIKLVGHMIKAQGFE